MSAIGQAFSSSGDQNNQQNNLSVANTAGYNAQQSLQGLQQSASGNGAVQQQTQAALQAGTNQGVQNSAGVLANAKGINPAMAARTAASNATQATQNAANTSAMLQGQNTLGAQNAYASAANNQYGNAENAYNGVSSSQGAIGQSAVGSAASAVGSVAAMAAQGGMIKSNYAGGGTAIAPADGGASANANGPQSATGKFLLSSANNTPKPQAQMTQPNASQTPGQQLQQGFANLGQGLARAYRNTGAPPASAGFDANANTPPPPQYAQGGKASKVQAMVSPDERIINNKDVPAVAQGMKDALDAGKKVPGKAKVKGNSYANDTVPKSLNEGDIVLPRSVTQAKNPHWAAHAFVQAIMKKQGMK